MSPALRSDMDAYLGRVLAEALTGGGHAQKQRRDNVSSAAEGVHLGAWCGGRASFPNCRLFPGGDEGDWLACMTALKESSAVEYDRVAEELGLHASPTDQIECAREASSDEWRQFEQLSNLARRRNLFVCRAPTVSGEPRDLFELARDNVVHGLVRETFSSAVARYQAHHLGASELRDVFQLIAHDAARHLRFSMDLHQWLVGQLSPARCGILAALRCEAIEQLAAEIQPLSPDIQGFFGLPSVEQGRAILRHLARKDFVPPRKASDSLDRRREKGRSTCA